MSSPCYDTQVFLLSREWAAKRTVIIPAKPYAAIIGSLLKAKKYRLISLRTVFTSSGEDREAIVFD